MLIVRPGPFLHTPGLSRDTHPHERLRYVYRERDGRDVMRLVRQGWAGLCRGGARSDGRSFRTTLPPQHPFSMRTMRTSTRTRFVQCPLHGRRVERTIALRRFPWFPSGHPPSSFLSSTTTPPPQQQPQQPQPQQLGTTTKMDEQQFKVIVIPYGGGGHSSTIHLPPTELLKRTSILPRDLVSLHLTSRGEEQQQQQNEKRRRTARPPTAIVPRTDCILLSFGNIRAVAGRESVYILDAHTKMASSFAKDLAAVYAMEASGGECPELLFVEAVMRDTVDTYTRRIRIFEPIVDDFLGRAANEVFSESGVHQLVPLKDSLQSFELQLKQSLDCLTLILNDDKLMLDLLLTEQADARRKGVPVDFSRHESVELMLSVYSRQIQNLQQEVQFLLSRLQSKQEFIALALAGYRNRLVRMNVHLGIMAVATGMTTATTGLFGMNLISGLEDSPMAFVVVTGGSITVAMTVAAIYFSFLRGRILQQRAAQSLGEIQTFVNALSDMGALDYTVKKMMILQQQQQQQQDNDAGSSSTTPAMMDKVAFKNRLQEARMSGNVTDQEVDFLFGVLDTHKDNQLTPKDFMVGETSQNKK